MAQDTKDPNALLRFLVAADVTAFAAAASGGEHQMRVRRALLFAPLGIEQTPCFCWVSQRSREVIQVFDIWPSLGRFGSQEWGEKNLGETTCAPRQGLALQHVEQAVSVRQHSIPLCGKLVVRRCLVTGKNVHVTFRQVTCPAEPDRGPGT